MARYTRNIKPFPKIQTKSIKPIYTPRSSVSEPAIVFIAIIERNKVIDKRANTSNINLVYKKGLPK